MEVELVKTTCSGSEPVSVTETLCPKEGADASPDLVKNWIDGLSIGG